MCVCVCVRFVCVMREVYRKDPALHPVQPRCALRVGAETWNCPAGQLRTGLQAVVEGSVSWYAVTPSQRWHTLPLRKVPRSLVQSARVCEVSE